ncbi:pyrroloquinoline quinone biosynthesis peptide chaperone PqqD [Streptomyces sp. NPDC006516]|uniref:pyrroloquinoline quinone biosynthesis peptide chaperone PqqD n=1 Tax=Streptomyces sp. NPDC006516 TaxID=3154309 RepID=UPI0033A8BACF
MTASDPTWCPRPASGVILRHDRTRGKDVLLMPERVVVLEGSGRHVVELCDGTRTLRRIIEELAERFPQAPVDTEVGPFIERMRKEGWIR